MSFNSYKNKNQKRSNTSKDKSKTNLNSPNNLNQCKKEDIKTFFPEDINSPNQIFLKFPSLDKNNDSKSAINDSNDFKGDALDEEYAIIKKYGKTLMLTINIGFNLIIILKKFQNRA